MENLWNFHHIIFLFLISFQAWLFKSNGKGILKLIFFIIYYQPKGGFLTASRPLLSPHPLVNDFLIWYQTLLLCLNIVPKAYNSFRRSEKVKKRYQKKVSRFAHKCPVLRTSVPFCAHGLYFCSHLSEPIETVFSSFFALRGLLTNINCW